MVNKLVFNKVSFNMFIRLKVFGKIINHPIIVKLKFMNKY